MQNPIFDKFGRNKLTELLDEYLENNITLKIFRMRDVKLPERCGKNAGFDFFIPRDYNDGNNFIVDIGSSVLIPSGIKVKIPRGHALIAFNKSGISTKMELQVGACVVDENYTGEIHLHLINIGINPVELNPGMKILQFLLIKINYAIPMEISNEKDMLWNNKERGDGGFGSTGS